VTLTDGIEILQKLPTKGGAMRQHRGSRLLLLPKLTVMRRRKKRMSLALLLPKMPQQKLRLPRRSPKRNMKRKNKLKHMRIGLPTMRNLNSQSLKPESPINLNGRVLRLSWGRRNVPMKKC